jgi:putative transposase
MRGGTPQDDPQTERGPEPDASVQMLKTSHSLIYYTPFGLDPAAVDLMHEIKRIFTKYPFFGSHQIVAFLFQSGFSAG